MPYLAAVWAMLSPRLQSQMAGSATLSTIFRPRSQGCSRSNWLMRRNCSSGDHKRIPGWMQVHYRLQFDENGYARMYAFDTCKAFIRTMPLMMYAQSNPEDLDTRLEDHCPDEVRYLCMSRPVLPMAREEEQAILTDPLNQFAAR